MTGADHKERRADVMHEQPVKVTTKPEPTTPHDTTQLVHDLVPPPCTATAAKFEEGPSAGWVDVESQKRTKVAD
jgi:hypothetical protein